jgi:hypothetical protein
MNTLNLAHFYSHISTLSEDEQHNLDNVYTADSTTYTMALPLTMDSYQEDQTLPALRSYHDYSDYHTSD